jgi:hypothetical protein
MALEGATDTIHEGCNCENCPRAMRGALTAAFPHIVSAKDAEIAKWERFYDPIIDARDATIAARAAHIREIDAEAVRWREEAERLRKALQPFASFGDIADDLMRDRICDWFGLSHFTAARYALAALPQPPETQRARIALHEVMTAAAARRAQNGAKATQQRRDERGRFVAPVTADDEPADLLLPAEDLLLPAVACSGAVGVIVGVLAVRLGQAMGWW